jgi:hypothetical protein
MKLLLKILIVGLIGFIIYQSRWILTFKYEPEYYENFYYESQYTYPQSARGISDGTLFKFIGYRLTQGENPFNINWEIPPLGKVLYGYSSRLFGNPYWFSIICYFGALIFFFKLLSKNFKNKLVAFSGIVMLILIPHFSNQVPDTMLDLPLTFAYMVHMYFFFEYIDKKKTITLVIAGLLLGIASAIKPPVYVPFIVLSELVIVYLTERKWKNMILFPATVFGGYVLGYFVYFIHHPNPIPWMKLHKKIYDFYLGPALTVKPLAAIKEVFNLGTWGPLYIAGILAYLVAGYSYFKDRKDLKLLTLLLFTTIFLAVSSFIPFFPRYLLPLSFAFVYLILYVIKGNLKFILLLCLLSLPFFYKSFTLAIPTGDAAAAARFMETRAYRELYRSINPGKLKDLPEKDFIVGLEDFNSEIHARKVEVKVGEGKKTNGKYYYDFDVKYFTKFGVVENSIPFEYENINGQWKLNWSWDNVYKGYTPGSSVKFVTTPGNLIKVYEVYIIPRLMYDWNKNLDNLARLTGQPSIAINSSLTSVVPNDFERFVGYLHKNITDAERDRFIKDKGAVRIKEVLLNPNTETDKNSLTFK